HGRLGLPPAATLSRSQEHCSVPTHERRVVRVDRIGVPRVVARDDHLRTRLLEEKTERLVLLAGANGVGCSMPAVLAPGRGVLRQRRTHQHTPELTDHRGASIERHGTTTALAGILSSSSTARRPSTQSIPIATRVSRVALPRWGVSTTLSSERNPS